MYPGCIYRGVHPGMPQGRVYTVVYTQVCLPCSVYTVVYTQVCLPGGYIQGGVYSGMPPGTMVGYVHHPVYTLLYAPGYTLYIHPLYRTPGYTVTSISSAGRGSPGLKKGITPGWEARGGLMLLILLG